MKKENIEHIQMNEQINEEEAEKKMKCRICKEIKPIEQMEKDSRVRGGVTNRCYKCKRQSETRGSRLYQRLKNRDHAPVLVAPNELDLLYNRFGGTCAYCGKHEEDSDTSFHVDHIVPIKKGGYHVAENLVLSCPSCNQRKQDLDILTFMHKYDINPLSLHVIIQHIHETGGIPKMEILARMVARQTADTFNRIEGADKYNYRNFLNEARMTVNKAQAMRKERRGGNDGSTINEEGA